MFLYRLHERPLCLLQRIPPVPPCPPLTLTAASTKRVVRRGPRCAKGDVPAHAAPAALETPVEQQPTPANRHFVIRRLTLTFVMFVACTLLILGAGTQNMFCNFACITCRCALWGAYSVRAVKVVRVVISALDNFQNGRSIDWAPFITATTDFISSPLTFALPLGEITACTFHEVTFLCFPSRFTL